MIELTKAQKNIARKLIDLDLEKQWESLSAMKNIKL